MHCKHFTISQRLFCPFCQKQIIIRRANLTREKVRVVFNLTLCYSSVFVNTAGNSLQQLKTIIPNLNWISTHLWNWTTIHISERSYPMVEKAAARILTKTKKKPDQLLFIGSPSMSEQTLWCLWWLQKSWMGTHLYTCLISSNLINMPRTRGSCQSWNEVNRL